MYATSSRSRSLSITISPISPLGISTRPERRSSASMSSTIARSRSGDMSRFLCRLLQAGEKASGGRSPRASVLLRDVERDKPRCARYVVNRCPHCRHSRLRRIASPTSESRESTNLQVVVTAVRAPHVVAPTSGCEGTPGCLMSVISSVPNRGAPSRGPCAVCRA